MERLTAEWEGTESGADKLILRKRKGKISVSEAAEYLRRSNRGLLQGNYAVIIRAGEETCEGTGWLMEDEPEGDVLELYRLDGEGRCPVCGEMAPALEWCPECGANLQGKEESRQDAADDVEKILAFYMEDHRKLMSQNISEDSKDCWEHETWGMLVLAKELKLISEERYKQLGEQLKRNRQECSRTGGRA